MVRDSLNQQIFNNKVITGIIFMDEIIEMALIIKNFLGVTAFK